jgi:hypothetical protein
MDTATTGRKVDQDTCRLLDTDIRSYLRKLRRWRSLGR